MELTHYADIEGRTVGDIVSEDYKLGAVFKRHGIDFCCGGGRTVTEACTKAGVSIDTLAADLDRARSRDTSPANPRDWPLDFLAEYIINVHHSYVREQLPVLRQFSEKVARVHGAAEPSLVEIAELVGELAEEMTSHMRDEEEILFPVARRLAEGGPDRAEDMSDVLAKMMDEHEHAGGVMARLRQLSNGFRPPEHACNTYRALFSSLAEFEQDLHLHVHLENNVLFRRVASLLEA